MGFLKNNNKNTMYQNLWDPFKAVSKEKKFIALHIYINKNKIMKIN